MKFEAKIETKNLILRPYLNDDYRNWLSAFNNRYPSQNRFDKGKMDMSECTEEWFKSLVNDHQERAINDKEYIFGVFRKFDSNHIGFVDFSTLIRDNFQWARMGYTIHNQFWRKGYGEEAVTGAINFGFENLHYHRIEAHIDPANLPSIGLAKKVGMTFECIRNSFILESDRWIDQCVYYINKE